MSKSPAPSVSWHVLARTSSRVDALSTTKYFPSEEPMLFGNSCRAHRGPRASGHRSRLGIEQLKNTFNPAADEPPCYTHDQTLAWLALTGASRYRLGAVDPSRTSRVSQANWFVFDASEGEESNFASCSAAERQYLPSWFRMTSTCGWPFGPSLGHPRFREA